MHFLPSAVTGALINVGDEELVTIDARQNGDPNNVNTQAGSWPVPIVVTAGQYRLEFIDSVPNRVAWNYGDPNVWWVGQMSVLHEDFSFLFGPEKTGQGTTVASAFANTPNKIHFFQVEADETLYTHIGDWFLADNAGGLAFTLQKVGEIPEPASVGLAGAFAVAAMRRGRRGAR
jgi:hypothetical protein